MTIFSSDNVTGACPEVMDAIISANDGIVESYGNDKWSLNLQKKLSEILGRHYVLKCEKIDREKSVGHLVKAAIDMGAEVVDEQSMKTILEGEDDQSE